MTGPDGYACLIDPAVSVGHAEADLAMTELFGGFSPAFYEAYREAADLLPGYADRRDLYLRLKARGFKFANIISPKASIRGTVSGDNCWIHDFVVIQNDTTIGNNVAIMAQSLIGDNAVIEDHCFLGAKSTVGGGSVIGEQTFVGINCTVFDDTKVGKKCILGACTSVKRNVLDYSLYKTSSEIVIKQYGEDVIESKLMFSKNVRK